jgi:hypothetical protein
MHISARHFWLGFEILVFGTFGLCGTECVAVLISDLSSRQAAFVHIGDLSCGRQQLPET